MLNVSGKAKALALATYFDDLLTKVIAVNPGPSRETSLVRTKLEEASFFAKKAMAQDPANCEAT